MKIYKVVFKKPLDPLIPALFEMGKYQRVNDARETRIFRSKEVTALEIYDYRESGWVVESLEYCDASFEPLDIDAFMSDTGVEEWFL